MTKKAKKQGFTLVEIMIVVAIIGLLAAIGIPSFAKARENARENACINNLRVIDAAKQQMAITGNLADTVVIANDNAELISYLKGNVILTCPVNGGTYNVGAVSALPTCPDNGTTHDVNNKGAGGTGAL